MFKSYNILKINFQGMPCHLKINLHWSSQNTSDCITGSTLQLLSHLPKLLFVWRLLKCSWTFASWLALQSPNLVTLHFFFHIFLLKSHFPTLNMESESCNHQVEPEPNKWYLCLQFCYTLTETISPSDTCLQFCGTLVLRMFLAHCS